MAEAVGLSCIQIPYHVAAPKRYMVVMADREENGLHYFLTAEEIETFATAMLELICDN